MIQQRVRENLAIAQSVSPSRQLSKENGQGYGQIRVDNEIQTLQQFNTQRQAGVQSQILGQKQSINSENSQRNLLDDQIRTVVLSYTSEYDKMRNNLASDFLEKASPVDKQIINNEVAIQKAIDNPQEVISHVRNRLDGETALELQVILNSKNKKVILSALKKLGIAEMPEEDRKTRFTELVQIPNNSSFNDTTVDKNILHKITDIANHPDKHLQKHYDQLTLQESTNLRNIFASKNKYKIMRALELLKEPLQKI